MTEIGEHYPRNTLRALKAAASNAGLQDVGPHFAFCTKISGSAFVDAHKNSVPIATSARSAFCCVVTR